MFADLTGRKAVLIERNVTYHLLPAGSVLFTQTLLPNPGHSESSPLFVVVIIVLGPLPGTDQIIVTGPGEHLRRGKDGPASGNFVLIHETTGPEPACYR